MVCQELIHNSFMKLKRDYNNHEIQEGETKMSLSLATASETKISHLALYLRISQEKKSENVETLSNHRQLLTEYCKENGFTYEEFGEVLSGGASELEERPQLQRLLDNIEKYDAVLVVELSRISRNGYISQLVKKYCMEYDKPILTPFQMYDLANNENDRLMYDFGSTISAHEHGVIGKRSKSNKKQMAKQGLHVSGGIPYGYRRNPATKKLEIYEPEAEVIRFIFKLHSQGLGSFKIRDILNEETGYKPAKGSHWNLPSIKRIIRNETYKGTVFFNDRKRIKKAGKWTYEILDTIRVENAHPAVISPKEWDEANKEREDRASRASIVREKPAVKSGITALKDLIYCGCCGRKMTIRLDNKSATGYTVKKCEYLLPNGQKCNNNGIRLAFVEEEVMDRLKVYKSELDSILKDLEASDTTQIINEQQQRLSQVNKRIQEIEEEKKNLLRMAIKNLIEDEELREMRQELEDELKVKLSQRESLIREMESPSIEDIQQKIVGIKFTIENLSTLKPEGVNQSLKTFIKQITYTRVIPEELLKKSTRNQERQLYPFDIEIEYY